MIVEQVEKKMLAILASRWWIPTIKGANAVLFAAIIISRMPLAIGNVAVMFGVYCLIDGWLSFALGRGTQSRRNRLQGKTWAAGLVSLGAAAASLAWSDISVEWLAIVAATWLVLRGIAEVLASNTLRKFVPSEQLLLWIGASAMVFNFALLLAVLLWSSTVPWLIAIAAAVRGVLFIAMGIELRKFGTEFRDRVAIPRHHLSSLMRRQYRP